MHGSDTEPHRTGSMVAVAPKLLNTASKLPPPPLLSPLCRRRKVYDQTGSLEHSEGLAGEKFEDLYQYYRNIYKKVSEEDIDNVAGEFRGSQEETEEVAKYYQQFKGNMEKVACQNPSQFGLGVIAQKKNEICAE